MSPFFKAAAVVLGHIVDKVVDGFAIALGATLGVITALYWWFA